MQYSVLLPVSLTFSISFIPLWTRKRNWKIKSHVQQSLPTLILFSIELSVIQIFTLTFRLLLFLLFPYFLETSLFPLKCLYFQGSILLLYLFQFSAIVAIFQGFKVFPILIKSFSSLSSTTWMLLFQSLSLPFVSVQSLLVLEIIYLFFCIYFQT